jgi:hypothetical protein
MAQRRYSRRTQKAARRVNGMCPDPPSGFARSVVSVLATTKLLLCLGRHQFYSGRRTQGAGGAVFSASTMMMVPHRLPSTRVHQW